MSTDTPTPIPNDAAGLRFAIVAARWNGEITDELASACHKTLIDCGADPDDVVTYRVPGAVELTFAASQLIETSQFDAIIVFGCVVRGDTPHFDYVCQSVTQGVTALNADCDTPVIFGLLTVENRQQALDRIGGPHGHKGTEAAHAAIEMARFKLSV